MKLVKVFIFVMIVAGSNLFAKNLNTISEIVDQINHTNNMETKIELIKKLDKNLFEINSEELLEALHIIDKKLVRFESRRLESNI